jgi:hypothetical protein
VLIAGVPFLMVVVVVVVVAYHSDIGLDCGEPRRHHCNILDHQAVPGARVCSMGEGGAYVQHHSWPDLHSRGQLDHVHPQLERHSWVPKAPSISVTLMVS